MAKEVVTLPNKPIGRFQPFPVSPAIKAGDYIFVSGSSGTIDAQGKLVEGTGPQTKQCLENLNQVLKAAGSSLDDVVKVTVFLVNASDFLLMNEAYHSCFPKDYPARSTVIGGLARPGALVEIECIAYHPQS